MSHPQKPLVLSPDLSLPLDFVSRTIAILGIRGSGKTNTASVVIEELLDRNLPAVVIDPTDAWWGVRSQYPVFIFGGAHGDVPLAETDGKVVASIGDNYEPFPEGPAAVKHWIDKLGQCPSMLLATVQRHGMISRADLAERSGYSITSSTFANSLSELRVLGLVQSDRENVWLAPEFNP